MSTSKEDTKPASEYPDEVTFAWNRASREMVLVMQPASVVFTDSGPITDTRKPARRIKVKNGLYTTSDRDEIEFLTGHKYFNSKSIDGFSIVKTLSPEDEMKALMKRHKMTKKELAELAQAE